MIAPFRRKPIFLAASLFLVAALPAPAQGSPIPKTLGAGKAPDGAAILAADCSACHDWALANGALADSGAIVPGKPESSPAWIAVSEDRMPPDAPLSKVDKDSLLAWINAGAPKSAAAEASSGVPVPSASFLGFKSKEGFHRASGWASGGILLAAGVVGAAHALDMMNAAHAVRDTYPEDSLNDGNSPICRAEIAVVYDDPTEQALRWAHVGLLAAGESFYLANALTGTGFMGKLGPGWSKAKIHRYAFFLHAGLMVAEGVMGYFSSDALRRGDHETFHSLLQAHAAVGIAIPVVILGAGAIMDSRVRL
jgi:hypothetical protein